MEQQPQQAASSSATTTSPSSSQRRELQGPRPAPLKLRKDSHKIRKPPGGGPVQLQQQVRQPVIIYTLSPKVVHAEPGEFMSVVQRLTGATATASSSSSSLPAPPPPGLTTTEPHHHQIQMTTSSSLPFPFPFLGGHQQQYVHAPPPPPPPPSSAQLLPPAAPQFPFQLQQLSPAADVIGGGLLPPFPSVLSPGSLPAIPPSFFSPPGICLFGGLISPAAFLGNETTGGGSNSMMSIAAMAGATHQSVMSSSLQDASPSTVTPSPSDGAYHWDPFNNQH